MDMIKHMMCRKFMASLALIVLKMIMNVLYVWLNVVIRQSCHVDICVYVMNVQKHYGNKPINVQYAENQFKV